MVFIREEAAGRRLRVLHCGGRYGHEQSLRQRGAAQYLQTQVLAHWHWQHLGQGSQVQALLQQPLQAPVLQAVHGRA